MGMIHVKALDPGKANGWAEITVDGGKVVEHKVAELNHFELGETLAAIENLPETIFVCERYVMGGKISQSPWSLESIGLMRYFGEKIGVSMELVSTSSHKNLIGGEGVKRANLWVRGKPHAMDATSVGLWYLTTKRNMHDFLRTNDSGSDQG